MYDPTIKIIGIVEVECPKCGCKTSKKKQMLDGPDGTILAEYGECTSCGASTFYTQINDPISVSIDPYKKPSVTYPYCGSTNTKKISFSSKAVHTALFGIFAVGKVSKQWHCNQCKSDF